MYQATYAIDTAAALRRSRSSSQSINASVKKTMTSNSRWMKACSSGKKRNVLAKTGTAIARVVSDRSACSRIQKAPAMTTM